MSRTPASLRALRPQQPVMRKSVYVNVVSPFSAVGLVVGLAVGLAVGVGVGLELVVGLAVGTLVGLRVAVGLAVGTRVGARVGVEARLIVAELSSSTA